MSFAIPWILWGLLAIPLVVALFFYRKQVKVVVVPAITAWVPLGEPANTSRLRHLLRRLLTLLLEILVVALLVFGAAEPIFRARGASSAVIVLDASATMRTRMASGQTRAQAAREVAERVVSALPSDSEVRLVIASDVPRTVADIGTAPSAVRRAIAQVGPEQIDSDLPEAVRLAASLLGASPQAELIVISDFAAAEPGLIRQAYRGQGKLRLLPVGDNQPNAAISHVWSESPEAGQLKLHVTLRQIGMEGQAARLSVWSNGTQLTSAETTLSDPSVPLTLSIANPAAPQVLEVRLDAADALDLDNHFYLQSAAAGRRILLVTDGNLPLEAVLGSGENTQVRSVRPEDFRSAGPRAGAGAGESAGESAGGARIVVFDRLQPSGLRPESGVSYFFIGTPDPFGWVQPAGRKAVSSPTSWAAGHPLLLDVAPTIIPSQQALTITPAPGVEIDSLIDCGDTPLLVESRTNRAGFAEEQGRSLYFLADPFGTSFPGTLAFPVLMLNAVDYLAQGNDHHAPYLRTGQSIQVVSSAGLAGSVRLPRFEQIGIQQVQTAQGPQAVGVNYISSRPTRLLPARPADEIETPRGSALASIAQRLRLSPETLILAGLVLAVLEFTLFHRGRLHLD